MSEPDDSTNDGEATPASVQPSEGAATVGEELGDSEQRSGSVPPTLELGDSIQGSGAGTRDDPDVIVHRRR